MFKKTLVVTLVSAIMFALTGYLLARLLGFGNQDAVIIGVACVFQHDYWVKTVADNCSTPQARVKRLLLAFAVAVDCD
ncbi:MAG: hypothetical protein ACNYPI_02460 [Arenicellales bacterium WSBS_2016_MAG_OTU3]